MNLSGNRHLWLMLLCCLIPIGLLGAIFLFGVPASKALIFGMILLCPLLHILMMVLGGHAHGQEAGHHDHKPAALSEDTSSLVSGGKRSA